MPVLITTNRVSGFGEPALQNQQSRVDVTPNVCPVCHVTIEPDFLTGTAGSTASDWLEIYYRCTNQRCRRQFTGLYRRTGSSGNVGMYVFERSVPETPRAPVVDPSVANLSPNFVTIFAEATAAESYGLTEVAGPGYRKALEFLVKDYAISLNPNSADEIRNIQLGAVIAKYLTGDKLPIVSSRAAWLGNDQTHYERRWLGKDLQDLKKLIGAVMHFVAMERLAADLPTQMPTTGPVPLAPPTTT